MALDTATNLTQAIQDWLEDNDTEFQGSIPDVINLAELRVIRDLDLEIFRGIDSSVTLAIGVDVVTKAVIAAPQQRIATKQLWLSGGGLPKLTPLELRSFDYVTDHLTTTNGQPKYFAEISETTWQLSPAPDATYTLNERFLGRPPKLAVSSQETNWLITNIPDFLFLACKAEAEAFLKSDDRITIWSSLYDTRLPLARREVAELMGTQYDRLGATPAVNLPRSFNP